MIPRIVRTGEAMKAARHALGFSTDSLARMVRVEDGRTVRRWEAGDREIPGPVIVLMETAMGYLAEKAEIAKQLKMLRSRKMKTHSNHGREMVDDTADEIERLLEADKSYDEALEIITRQPQVGVPSTQVHWYNLQRMTPRFDPSQHDDWSIPGELSPDAALAYFQKQDDIDGQLELCCDGDLSADFVLEEREVLRSQFGASQRLSAGKLIKTYHVRRA